MEESAAKTAVVQFLTELTESAGESHNRITAKTQRTQRGQDAGRSEADLSAVSVAEIPP